MVPQTEIPENPTRWNRPPATPVAGAVDEPCRHSGPDDNTDLATPSPLAADRDRTQRHTVNIPARSPESQLHRGESTRGVGPTAGADI